MVSHGIVLEVERPQQNICFIATPYAEDFNGLIQIVANAASPAGLKPLVARDLPVGASFSEDVYRNIRQATLVVGVCSSERGDSAPNVNVIYEVGLAMGSRKPVLLLTANPDQLPANLKHLAAISYSAHEVQLIEGLLDRITLAMERLKRHWDEHQLTDSRAGDVWVCVLTDVIHVKNGGRASRDPKSAFGESLLSVMKATIAARRELGSVLFEKLGPLKAQAQKLTAEMDTALDLYSAWLTYRRNHRAVVALAHEFLTTWNLFLKLPGANQASWAKAKEFYGSAEQSVRAMLEAHHGADEILTQGKENLGTIVEMRNLVAWRLVRLHGDVEGVCFDLEELIQRLMAGIVDWLDSLE